MPDVQRLPTSAPSAQRIESLGDVVRVPFDHGRQFAGRRLDQKSAVAVALQ
jgi:hypothetical protein